MYKIITRLRNMDEIDIGVLALTGLSFGVIIALAKEKFAKRFAGLFAIIAVVGAVYTALKLTDGTENIEYDKITPIKFEG